MRKIKFRTVPLYLSIVFLFYMVLSFILINYFLLRNRFYWAIALIASVGVITSLLLMVGRRLKEMLWDNQKLNSDLNKAIFDILALFEFTNVLGSELNLTQLLELIVDTIKRIHCYDGCCLFFYDEQHHQFSAKVNRGFPAELSKTKFPIDHFLGGATLKSGQAIIIKNIELDEEYSDFKSKYPNYRELLGEYNSFAILPLLVEQKLIGVLLLSKYLASAYSQDDLRLLLIISSQAGLAIQNRRLYEQVYYSAITDGLTGIYNQKYFREQLEYQLEKAKEYGFKISLILLDIDHFKKFNDTYGHQIGDKVLKEVSRVIQECVNPDNLVARYGGEEFVIILPDFTTENAVAVAEKIRGAIEKHPIKTNEYSDLKVTISLGVATFPDHIQNMKRMVVELVDIADENLYSAKNAGRNCVCFPNAPIKGSRRTEN